MNNPVNDKVEVHPRWGKSGKAVKGQSMFHRGTYDLILGGPQKLTDTVDKLPTDKRGQWVGFRLVRSKI